MKYTVKLGKSDTECLRQTLSEAYGNGKEQALGDATTKEACAGIFRRLLDQIEMQAQHIAEAAFEAGRKSPPMI